MGKRVAIIQSNYIPWKGYFNIIKCVDEFVFLDDVQFTRRDWRNRNLIKTEKGLKWLSIPVDVKGQYFIKIKDVQTAGSQWRKDHWNQIVAAYRKAAYFSTLAPLFQEMYLKEEEKSLSLINYGFIKLVNSILKINTPLRFSTDFDSPSGKTEGLVQICKTLGADSYLSGIAAKDYLDENLFHQEKIKVSWTDYSNYPEYDQLYPPFNHRVSILDLLFNEGPGANQLLKDKIWV